MGDRYYDRIYASNKVVELALLKWCEMNGYKPVWQMGLYLEISLNKNKDINFYPYMDSFWHLNKEKSVLGTSMQSRDGYKLSALHGHLENYRINRR